MVSPTVLFVLEEYFFSQHRPVIWAIVGARLLLLPIKRILPLRFASSLPFNAGRQPVTMIVVFGFLFLKSGSMCFSSFVLFLKLSDRLAAFGRGALCNAACIYDEQFGRWNVIGFDESESDEQFSYLLGFVLVDFTAERVDGEYFYCIHNFL